MQHDMVYVDMINLNGRDKRRFQEFYINASKHMDIESIVQVWNHYATCVEEHVFFRRKGETRGKQ